VGTGQADLRAFGDPAGVPKRDGNGIRTENDPEDR